MLRAAERFVLELGVLWRLRPSSTPSGEPCRGQGSLLIFAIILHFSAMTLHFSAMTLHFSAMTLHFSAKFGSKFRKGLGLGDAPRSNDFRR